MTEAEWYRKGFEAGKRANPSGCCCVIDSDGETVLEMCFAHASIVHRYKAGLRLALAQRLKLPWQNITETDLEAIMREAEELEED